MLGIPETGEAEAIGFLGEAHGFGHSLGRRGALGNGSEILEGQGEISGHDKNFR